MKPLRLLNATTIFMLLMMMAIGCATTNSMPTPLPTSKQTPAKESAESQARGNGTVELVTDPIHDRTYSAKLAIAENYNLGDAARIAVPLNDVTLYGITSLSFWCYVDTDTPVNPDSVYWVPYITFELDTDGEPGCDTWVNGGGGGVSQSSGVWFKTPWRVTGYSTCPVFSLTTQVHSR